MSWRQVVVVLTAVALVACYAPTLRGMFEQWSSDEDMSHGFLVPIVILWIIWRERGRWRVLRAEPNLWGFALLAAAAGVQFAGVLGAGAVGSIIANSAPRPVYYGAPPPQQYYYGPPQPVYYQPPPRYYQPPPVYVDQYGNYYSR